MIPVNSQLTSLPSCSSQWNCSLSTFNLSSFCSQSSEVGAFPPYSVHLYLFKFSPIFNIQIKDCIFQEARWDLAPFYMYFYGIFLTLTLYLLIYFLSPLGNSIKGATDHNIWVSEFLTLSKFLIFSQPLLDCIQYGCYLKCTRLIKKKTNHFFFLPLVWKGCWQRKRKYERSWCFCKEIWCDCSFLQNFPFYVI